MTTEPNEQVDYSENIPAPLYEEIYGMTEALSDTRAEAKQRRHEFLKMIQDFSRSQTNKTIQRIKDALEKQVITFHGIEHMNGVEVFNEGVEAVDIAKVRELLDKEKNNGEN